MAEGRRGGASRSSVWRISAVMAAAGHVLLVPLYFAARWYDLTRQPFGFGHWPGEPLWPAGSGSSEWQPGFGPPLVSWLLLLVVVLWVSTVAGLVALSRRLRHHAGSAR